MPMAIKLGEEGENYLIRSGSNLPACGTRDMGQLKFCCGRVEDGGEKGRMEEMGR